MNVLIFNTLYDPNFIGGAERSVQALAEGLVKAGHKITVVSTSNTDDETIVNGVRVFYIKSRNIYWGFEGENHSGIKKAIWHSVDSYDFRLKSRVTEIIKGINPDVVHTNNLSGFSVVVWNISKSLGFKIVHTLRDYYLSCPKTTMFRDGKNCKKQCLSCKVYSIPKQINSHKVDAVVGISEYIRQRYKDLNYFKNAKISEVIGNDVGEFGVSKKSFSSKKITFGFIGQISEAKGIELLVSVFNQLKKTNWELLVGGTGNKFDELKKNNDTERIRFLGKVDSSVFYSKLNVLIVPSLWQEPFGRVVLEGQKAGVFVIGSNRGGIKELLPTKNLFEPTVKGLRLILESILNLQKLPIHSSVDKFDVTRAYEIVYNKMIALE